MKDNITGMLQGHYNSLFLFFKLFLKIKSRYTMGYERELEERKW